MVITSIGRRWQLYLRKAVHTPILRVPASLAGSFLLGLVLSAASLAQHMQPLCLAVLCGGLPGWLPVPFVLGSCVGFRLLWAQAGLQGFAWLALGLPVGVLLSSRARRMPLLLPAFAALIVSASGVAFQFWQGDDTAVPIYLLRVTLAFGATWIFQQMRLNRQSPADWVGTAFLVLGLGQLAPTPYWNLGILAAAFLAPAMPFPAAALAGLALDLGQVSRVSMTAVFCLSCLLRLIPTKNRRVHGLWPVVLYGPLMALWGGMELYPIPALAAGCLASLLVPLQTPRAIRRGDTGLAQVRLELAAEVLSQSQVLLQQVQEHPIDEEALLEKAAQRACGNCPQRSGCAQAEYIGELPTTILYSDLEAEDLPAGCRKRSRLLPELRRSQEQLRRLRADRRRQQEYRSAVVQQYRFLSAYLQELADKLPRQAQEVTPRFQPEIAASTAGRERVSGDRCCWFAGAGCRYFVLLCDGMGTGTEAAEAAKTAGDMLRKLLMAGLPASYALRSLNSLWVLQGRAGAVTVDLAELQLDTGKITLYKWGAAPSYVLTFNGPERVGQVGTPPGLSVTESQETVSHLRLRRGQALVLFSDGVVADAAVECVAEGTWEPSAPLAHRLLKKGMGTDDATVAVIRLQPLF